MIWNSCEAMVEVNHTWTRCGKQPVDLHHRLTRARGGLILDAARETYHLMYLCRKHHNIAHDEPPDEKGLLIDGYVTVCQCRRPLYQGSDAVLGAKYGQVVHVQCLWERLRGDDPGEGLRGEA